MSQNIYLTREVALGNGTRPAGYLIGTEHGDQVMPADGVEPVEIQNLVRNPDLMTTEAPAVYSGPESIHVPEAGELTLDGQPGIDLSSRAEWRAIPTGQIPGLDPAHAQLLIGHQLNTAGEIVDYGQAHKGLTDLKGIGKSTASAITGCLARLLQVPPPDDLDG